MTLLPLSAVGREFIFFFWKQINWFSISTLSYKDALNLTKRFNKVCIDLVNWRILLHQYFLIGRKSLIWEYYTTNWTFNNALAQKRTRETWFLDCHKYCLNKILILCTFYVPIFQLDFELAWQKKSLSLPKHHWSNGIVERSKSKCKLCMLQSEAGIDSALIQWHTGIVRMTVL